MDNARLLIGSGAELIRFGHLSKGAPLEGVAILRSQKSSRMGGIPIASLSILRRDGATWVRVFEANREMRNPEGYVGLDYIDDGWKFEGYDVSLSDKGSDNTDRFTLYFTQLGPDPGWPTEVAWNKATGRYQEFGDDSTAEHQLFKSELKDPPHRNTAAQSR
jgi:hypothetical protein